MNVATDVSCHDDELFAFELLDVCVVGILAGTRKRELEALAALAAVGGRHCCECKAVFVTSIDRERNLACAGGSCSAGANAAAAVTDGVLAFGIANLGRISSRVFVPGAARHAAIPVTGCPARTACTALGLDCRALAGDS